MANSIYELTEKTIDGAAKSLGDYRGRVLLIVNVASQCGLTPQYRGLEALHEAYGARGLSILGFPANEFGAQEPGTDDEIRTFCSSRYGVKFDMFAKVKVKGAEIDPLFAFLTSPAAHPGHPERAGDIKWNFNKFLVGKDGQVLARFEPQTEPTGADVKDAIEKALSSP